MRETYTNAAAAGFAIFKEQVNLFVKISNSVLDDEDDFLEKLDDEDMEELRREVHTWEQERLDMYCNFKLYWKSTDKQGSIPMGEYRSRPAAEAAIPGAEAELLTNAVSKFNPASEILDGTWEVVRVPYC